jgi:hypothetical protein
MEQTLGVVVAAILLGVLAIGGLLYALKQRRSRDLRSRFGPEYDRVIAANGDRRAAEHELAEREKRAKGLSLRALRDDERDGFARAWSSIQRRFVDDPVAALNEAHTLLEEVMRQRGYPTRSFEEEVALLSVHHPGAVQHFRAAHMLARDRQGGAGGTEHMRQAVIHYRVLFEDMLEMERPENSDRVRDVTGDHTPDEIRETDEMQDTRPYPGAPLERRRTQRS